MNNLKLLILCFSLTFSLSLQAQNITNEDSIKNVITSFFEGMKKHDTIQIRGSLAPEVIFQTITRNKKGDLIVHNEDVSGFLKFVADHSTDDLDEQIVFDMLRIDGNLASVWTPYRFFLNKKFSHCGANSFQLVRFDNIWKIQYIIDTRRRNCD
jgi:hypothetical protein